MRYFLYRWKNNRSNRCDLYRVGRGGLVYVFLASQLEGQWKRIGLKGLEHNFEETAEEAEFVEDITKEEAAMILFSCMEPA